MKKQTGIWIDSTKAVIVKFQDGKETTLEVLSEIENRVHHSGEGDKGSFAGNQHMNNEKVFDERNKHEVARYLKNVMEQIISDDELYIFGPAEMKQKLEKAIKETKTGSPKSITIETAQKITLNQIKAQVRKFYDL